jgi:predicted nucleic acid-binding protein
VTVATATCDTSLLLAALADWHPVHNRAREALRGRVTSVPAHTLLECYSVLTRLPGEHRVATATAGQLLDELQLGSLECPADRHRALVQRLSAAGIGGGAIYDGLVGETARYHGLTLLSLDRRARTTYDAVGATSELLV